MPDLIEEIFGLPDSGAGPLELTEPEAVAGVALAAIAWKGDPGQADAYRLSVVLPTLRHFRDAAAHDVHRVMGRVLRIARTRGMDSLLQSSAAALPATLRPGAFALSMDLLVEGEELAPERRAWAEKLQRALEVPPPQAADLVEAAVLRHRV